MERETPGQRPRPNYGHPQASELFEEGREGRVVRPKEIYPIVEALGAEGHGLKASCRLLGVSGSGFLYNYKFRSENKRRIRLKRWIHNYNCHRHHTAVGGPPASRAHNLTRTDN